MSTILDVSDSDPQMTGRIDGASGFASISSVPEAEVLFVAEHTARARLPGEHTASHIIVEKLPHQVSVWQFANSHIGPPNGIVGQGAWAVASGSGSRFIT
jgi:hypothetical protein